MRLPLHLLVLLACLATAVVGLAPGDVAVADQMWSAASIDKAGEWSDPIWVDVDAAYRRVAPWQASYARARARRDLIEQGRRAALQGDAGAFPDGRAGTHQR